MKLLITGCDGQLGRSILERIPSGLCVAAFSSKQLDITHQKQVFSLIREQRPDYVINCAAYTAVDNAEIDADICNQVNRDGALYLAESTKELGATLIHFSTDYVFSGETMRPYSETGSTKPINIYGLSKLAGEEAVRECNEKHIIMRTSWVFSEYGNNFVKTMLKVGARLSEVSVVKDQLGGPTYAGDLANAVLSIIEKLEKGLKDYGTYHYSGVPYVSWADFAETVFSKAEKADLFPAPSLLHVSSEEYRSRAKRPKNSRLSNDKIFETFQIKPSNWQDALIDIGKFRVQ
ncbi:dTDP-4-dehydrorhamnose reductase [Vibrio ishigakensis]|uniref:dTDP-4-dehydrorhamnose reductase n=1 Tax=Vibrio ishigakensis TaxID=1481914 RepID=A0A0B8NST5_9VIBR|nr:dTDP-4-dehydrorhamnose reductase [Vibrio ishigakensis]GAM56906.1 dTDP-4-dehydrorhamnose reductase [Vibrio ishigakensis]